MMNETLHAHVGRDWMRDHRFYVFFGLWPDLERQHVGCLPDYWFEFELGFRSPFSLARCPGHWWVTIMSPVYGNICRWRFGNGGYVWHWGK